VFYWYTLLHCADEKEKCKKIVQLEMKVIILTQGRQFHVVGDKTDNPKDKQNK